MKIKLRTSEKQFEIYREKLGVTLYGTLLAALCFAFGIGFIYIGQEKNGSFMFLVGGLVFSAAGALLLVNLFRLTRRMNVDHGHALLVANDEGVSIAPLLNMELLAHPWRDLSRIVLAKKLVTRESGEKGYSWNQGIFFFIDSEPNKKMGLIERSKRQVWKSPNGLNVSSVDLPKNEMSQIKRELERFSGKTIKIEICSEMHLDYVNGEERCQS